MTVSLVLLEIEEQKGVGETTIDGYVGHIAVENFSWSISAETLEKPKAEPTTTIKPQTLTFRKHFDSASTVLCQMMEADKPFKATFRYIDPGTRIKGASAGSPQFESVLEVVLTECHIDSIALSADDSGKAVAISENITISFEDSIKFDYRAYDPASRARTKAVSATVKMPLKDVG